MVELGSKSDQSLDHIGGVLHVSSLTEVISAIHLSYWVNSPDSERGGLMLVSAPGSLKTSILTILENYSTARMLSDLTIRQAVEMREEIQSGRITTIAFSDFAKLYQRRQDTAANIEGFIRAIIAEGFRQANWEDPGMAVIPAHCAVIGCMTSTFKRTHFQRWKQDGIARRFLWCEYSLDDPRVILEAQHKNQRLDFGTNGFNTKVPTSRREIPYQISEEQSRLLEQMLRDQPAPEIPLIMMRKILAALRWKYQGDSRKPWQIIHDFAPSLRSTGTELVI